MFRKYHFDRKLIKYNIKKMREGNNPQGVSHAKEPFMAELYEIVRNEKCTEKPSRYTLYNWENENMTNLPGIQEMLAICNILEVDLDAIVGRSKVISKDYQTLKEVTHLNENALQQLNINPEKADFVNFLLNYNNPSDNTDDKDVLSDILSHCETLARSNNMEGVLKSCFDPELIKYIKSWFNEYYYSCFPMDLCEESFCTYIKEKLVTKKFKNKFAAEKLYNKYLMPDGKNYIDNIYNNFESINNTDQLNIIAKTISDISYQYLISTNVMLLSQHRIYYMFESIIKSYIEFLYERSHANIKQFAENHNNTNS